MAAALKARWLFTAVVAAAAGITAGPQPGGRSRVAGRIADVVHVLISAAR